MKKSIILATLMAASFLSHSQSSRQNKDSAYKYYILLNRSISESTNDEWKFFSNQYYKFRTACMKQFKTQADSLKYMTDMTDSLHRYKKNHS